MEQPFSTSPTPLVDERAAAQYLGLKTATLQQWRYRGMGPRFIKVGRLVRYRHSDLEAWLQERTRTSTADPGQTTSNAA